MLKKILACSFVIIAILLVFHLFKIDSIDNSRPFGTDTYKNERYAKNLVGEDYGVMTFWGKPQKNDTIKKSLDRIEWLNRTLHREVFWRKSLAFAIILGLIISIITETILSPPKLIAIFIACYVFIYMRRSYDSSHLYKIQTKFVTQNIRKIKRQLDVELCNFLDDVRII